MKNFVMGVSVGYLLTSLFSIGAPPILFWLACATIIVVSTPVGYAWWKINDDGLDGDF